jgi:hypothetical protein
MNIQNSKSILLHSLPTPMPLPDESTMGVPLVEQLRLHVVEAMP